MATVEGYRDTNLAPRQAHLVGSFDTNGTSAPDGIKGGIDVTRTGVGVFKIWKKLATTAAPAATYVQWDHYEVDIHGTDSSNYTIKVTAEDGNDLQPYVTVTVYIKTYAVGAIDTYAAAETTDLHICFRGTLLQTADM